MLWITVPLMGVRRCGRKFFSALGSARTNLDINLGSMRRATTLAGIVVNLYARELKRINTPSYMSLV